MTPLLVFGADGQVARALARIGPAFGFAPTLAGRATVDLSHDDGAALIARLAPAAVINAAAYTAVDRAEIEPEAAWRLNADVPGALARACAALDIPFVHLSTDYVFDGAQPGFYAESAPRAPLGVYGHSKAAGEAAVEAAMRRPGARWAIVRTAWVYGAVGHNFVRTMLRLAAERDEVAVVADQHGCPTWAPDVAQAALRLARGLIEHDAACAGLFHAAGAGEASWAEFAQAVFAGSAARGGPSTRVRPITTAQYPTPARRPANSRLACEALQAATGWRPPPWRESLDACLDELSGSASAPSTLFEGPPPPILGGGSEGLDTHPHSGGGGPP